ncbi:hypothetical protein DV515_00009509, partial [Chloebia gouldiae]
MALFCPFSVSRGICFSGKRTESTDFFDLETLKKMKTQAYKLQDIWDQLQLLLRRQRGSLFAQERQSMAKCWKMSFLPSRLTQRFFPLRLQLLRGSRGCNCPPSLQPANPKCWLRTSLLFLTSQEAGVRRWRIQSTCEEMALRAFLKQLGHLETRV